MQAFPHCPPCCQHCCLRRHFGRPLVARPSFTPPCILLSLSFCFPSALGPPTMSFISCFLSLCFPFRRIYYHKPRLVRPLLSGLSDRFYCVHCSTTRFSLWLFFFLLFSLYYHHCSRPPPLHSTTNHAFYFFILPSDLAYYYPVYLVVPFRMSALSLFCLAHLPPSF